MVDLALKINYLSIYPWSIITPKTLPSVFFACAKNLPLPSCRKHPPFARLKYSMQTLPGVFLCVQRHSHFGASGVVFYDISVHSAINNCSRRGVMQQKHSLSNNNNNNNKTSRSVFAGITWRKMPMFFHIRKNPTHEE